MFCQTFQLKAEALFHLPNGKHCGDKGVKAPCDITTLSDVTMLTIMGYYGVF